MAKISNLNFDQTDEGSFWSKVEGGLGESDQVESVKGFFSLVIDSSLFMNVQLWAKCLSFSNLFEVELFKVLSLH